MRGSRICLKKIAEEKNISNLFTNLEATSQPGVKSVGVQLM